MFRKVLRSEDAIWNRSDGDLGQSLTCVRAASGHGPRSGKGVLVCCIGDCWWPISNECFPLWVFAVLNERTTSTRRENESWGGNESECRKSGGKERESVCVMMEKMAVAVK